MVKCILGIIMATIAALRLGLRQPWRIHKVSDLAVVDKSKKL